MGYTGSRYSQSGKPYPSGKANPFNGPWRCPRCGRKDQDPEDSSRHQREECYRDVPMACLRCGWRKGNAAPGHEPVCQNSLRRVRPEGHVWAVKP